MKAQHNQTHKEYVLTLTILSQLSKFHSVTCNIQYPFQYIDSGFAYLLVSFYCITALNVGFIFFFFFTDSVIGILDLPYQTSMAIIFFSECLTFSYFVSLSWKFSSHFPTPPSPLSSPLHSSQSLDHNSLPHCRALPPS